MFYESLSSSLKHAAHAEDPYSELTGKHTEDKELKTAQRLSGRVQRSALMCPLQGFKPSSPSNKNVSSVAARPPNSSDPL